MDGNKPRLVNPKDFKDPFNAGQMIGMLTILVYLEERGSMPQDMLDELKWVCAGNAQAFLDKPSEDILLMASKAVKEMK